MAKSEKVVASKIELKRWPATQYAIESQVVTGLARAAMSSWISRLKRYFFFP
jgi:hypothetical protein